MVHSAFLVGALAALAAAIPQQAEHMSKAQITRINQVFARGDNILELAGRAVSTDGSCGPNSGLTCPQGTCCSSYGWCGSSPLHCGDGCQAKFGTCGADHSPAADTAPVVAPAASPVASPESKPAESKPNTQNAPIAPAAPAVPAPIAPQENNNAPEQPTTKSGGFGDVYKQYSGDGSTGAGWPTEDSWVDFETAFINNKRNMLSSCSKWGVKDTSEDEAKQVHDAILSAAASTGVDSRYILAVVMQESGGCVRAPTTNWGVRNPGLMQSFNGQGTCNEGGVQDPCPSSKISQMINDGTAGTGPGSNSLSSALERIGGNDVSRYYKAARIYNSGSIDSSGLLQNGIATHCYSSDIANRLTGWFSSSHSCTYDG